jgi:CDP-diacylglycerol--serine O-phosphatidyltransferase
MHKSLQTVPVYRLVPNFVTLLALSLGMTSIRYALDEKWHIAAGLILIAGFLDGLDGRLARLLNATSRFGAELDSLADMVSFGVAPAVTMYLWSLYQIPIKGLGWFVVLFYIACSALRLARYNSRLDDFDEKKKLQNYTTGMPITTAASICLLPMMLSFELTSFSISPWLVFVYITLIGLVMISRVPTFTFRTIHIRKSYVPFLMAAIALLTGASILEPWIIVPIVIILYLCTIPISIISFYRSGNK